MFFSATIRHFYETVCFMLLLVLLTGCSPLLNQQSSHLSLVSSITPIASLAEVNEYVTADPETIVLFDIDNTLLSSRTHFGSVEHFTQLVKDEMAATGCTEAQAKINSYATWGRAQEVAPTHLTDPYIIHYIHRVKSQGGMVMGLTARQSSIADLTLRQLRKHGIPLDDLGDIVFDRTYKNQVSPDIGPTNGAGNRVKYDHSQALLYKGVLFCHDLNAKGKVFKEFYSILDQYRKTKGIPPLKKIIFTDDVLGNVESMQGVARELGLDFYGFHFQYKNEFNPAQAAAEERELPTR